MIDTDMKLKILLACLRITCRYFQGDEEECKLAGDWNYKYTDLGEDEYDTHRACNCDGDINECDLPEKFWSAL